MTLEKVFCVASFCWCRNQLSPRNYLTELLYLLLTFNILIFTWPKMHSVVLSSPHCVPFWFQLMLLLELYEMHWKYLQATSAFLMKRLFADSVNIVICWTYGLVKEEKNGFMTLGRRVNQCFSKCLYGS